MLKPNREKTMKKVHEIVKKQLTAIVCAAVATFASVDATADTIWVDAANYGKTIPSEGAIAAGASQEVLTPTRCPIRTGKVVNGRIDIKSEVPNSVECL